MFVLLGSLCDGSDEAASCFFCTAGVSASPVAGTAGEGEAERVVSISGDFSNGPFLKQLIR